MHSQDPSNTRHPLDAFSKGDRLTALFCFLIALATFWFTAMPNVGLGDDGEMATAALHFGVPHPSGYPLWTILAGLFNQLIPFGNGAWKLNLFSGLCAALAVALFTLLARSTSRWLGLEGKPATLLTIAASLTFAWSVPVWSQATIGKGTYSLHVLLMLALTGLCYLWIRTPSWKNAFVWVVFSFSLGMSNHHMTLAMAVLPLLVILLLHADLFWEYTIYSLLIGSGLYVGFASLSNIPDAMKAALRLFYTIGVALILFVLIKKKLSEWKRGLLLIVAVVIGLLPYLYMPLASSTNPPMNWSYTSTREGFFYAINRSQYWGTLADQLQGTVGKIMGVPPAPKAVAVRGVGDESSVEAFLGFFKVFWRVLIKNISPLPLLGALLAVVFFLKSKRVFKLVQTDGSDRFLSRETIQPSSQQTLPLNSTTNEQLGHFIQSSPPQKVKSEWLLSREQCIWLILLVVGFFLSAFFEPLMAPNGYDATGWDMQKPWQGLCYGFLLLLASLGTASAFQALRKQMPQGRYLLIALACLVPFYTFYIGLPRSSQRGHWFGWMYGHDMLVDLPPDSFVFGGTDPGRFVPTYMVFGESFEKYKRDPNFDRRDLYIVTQNALADTLYNRYIRSQYSDERPSTFNWFERWMGRDHAYPKATLILPHREEIVALYEESMRRFQQNPGGPNPQTSPGVLNSAIAEWIFLRNRDQHRFFVEESFPMVWSYPHAIPHGLCYEINHDALPSLPPDVVAHDRQFWTDYIERLKTVDGFENDELGRHSFAKLRNTTGNIYASRGMKEDAEFAYNQALQLWPGNNETVENMINLLSQQGRYQEAHDLVTSSLVVDPYSKALQKMKAITEARLKAKRDLPQLQQQLKEDPTNRPILSKILQDFLVLGQQQNLDLFINNAIATTPNDVSLYREAINFYATQGRIPQALLVAQQLFNVQPNQWDVPLTIAKYQLVLGKQDAALESLGQAIKIGGAPAIQQITHDPMFQQLCQLPAFQELIQSPRSGN
ncbi:MAG TPA: DUF2723 domain-containing protein [Chthoniobacterales bacterium]|nr:DUF2723 domain-containing protein [Chthoniobacterales bacterium]